MDNQPLNPSPNRLSIYAPTSTSTAGAPASYENEESLASSFDGSTPFILGIRARKIWWGKGEVRQEVEDIVGATLDDSKAMNEGVLEGLRSPFRRHWASSQLRLLPPTTALVTWTAIFSESDLLLFPCYLSDDRLNDLYDEGVTVEKNGLVYPAVDARSVSNGAVMFLNTFMMQELVHRYFDEVLDREDEGSQFEKLFIYTVSKGTPIPSHLILVNECISRFSLQPSRGMLLKDEFYAEYGKDAETYVNAEGGCEGPDVLHGTMAPLDTRLGARGEEKEMGLGHD
ncbi:hypothetical protein MRS44_008319 [Fusarium solani]|uniref:uncharacterized protein n=1 Tax=Fusarium solani TaxID=169388 RepID=UPI0032C42932|nr:hypothetical protein MRS44_008319 [Fusarium solani]